MNWFFLNKISTLPLSMLSLDTIKKHSSLATDGKWQLRLAEPMAMGNEAVKVSDPPLADDHEITDVNGLPCYRMKSNPRGFGVIINNKIFSGGLRDRIGTDKDAASLKALFVRLGFNTEQYDNLTAREMVDKLTEISKIDHKKFDCLMVAILTHGIEGELHGTDGELISVKDLTKLFCNDKCPSLVGKPKIFILQACRGKNRDSGVNYDVTDGDGKEEEHWKINEEQFDVNLFGNEVFETDSGGLLNEFLFVIWLCMLIYYIAKG